MSEPTADAATALYARLTAAGVSMDRIREVLPEWWDDSLWSDPPSRWVYATYLSQLLDLDVSSVLDPESRVLSKQRDMTPAQRRRIQWRCHGMTSDEADEAEERFDAERIGP